MTASSDSGGDLVTLETEPEEATGGPIQVSQPDSKSDRTYASLAYSSYAHIGLDELQKRQSFVPGSFTLRSYCWIDNNNSGAEVRAPETQEISHTTPKATAPDELTQSDLFNYDGSASDLSTQQPKHKSGDDTSSDGSTFTENTPQHQQNSGEATCTSSGSSTDSTLRPKPKSQSSTSSGSSAVSNNQVFSLRGVLKLPKLLQMFDRKNTIKLKGQKMKLGSKHNPTLHLCLEVCGSSLENECIILHARIDVPPNYSRVLDTAKFQISVTITYHSASKTPFSLPQPQTQTFTLVQENKHMLFSLFSHTFLQQNSTSQSVHLAIEVQPIYYSQPKDEVLDHYVMKDPTDSVAFVDIQRVAGSELSTLQETDENPHSGSKDMESNVCRDHQST